MTAIVEGYTLTYVSDSYGKGGQHINGPDYGVFRCEHEMTKTAVEIHSYQARGPHKARELAIMLCKMAVEEMGKQ